MTARQERDERSQLDPATRETARQALIRRNAADLIPILGLDDAPMRTSHSYGRRYGGQYRGGR